MKVEQALVAAGGRASRLQAPGSYAPMAKSFLTVEGRPLLHWCLESLCLAGIKSVVLVGDREEFLERAEQVVRELPHGFDETRYFQDRGQGVHGLPYHARHLLGDSFFFECGHAVTEPSHYQAMDAARSENGIVFSAFRPHISNPRLPVKLDDGRVIVARDGECTGFALATPFLLDQPYAASLPSLEFNIHKIIGRYIETGQLQYVLSEMPPEFDTPQELQQTQEVYGKYLGLRNGDIPGS